MAVPKSPKIYHITHLRNLPGIASAEAIWSDAERLQRNLRCEVVGMSRIKKRRLKRIEVSCHPGTKVGQYAPFYFCPRSIMLFILHKGNHPELDYTEGQQPIVHLQADLKTAVQWAEERSIRWAFSDRNAGTYLVQFYRELNDLEEIDWTAVQETDFQDPGIKEGKQAEFLLWKSFPWSLIERIGVVETEAANVARKAIAAASHQPPIEVKRRWYY